MKAAPPTAIAELQHWPHWVVWRTEERNGKPTKVPLQPNGRPASSTDPETWSTYDDCVNAESPGRSRYDGIGYVFSSDDEYAGIDLDKCVVDGKVTFTARLIVDRLASYTEFSPTGTGLHVIVRARINGDRKRTAATPWGGDFESYDQARFFTITGRHLSGTPATIEARQKELDAIRAELFPPSDAKQNGAGARRDAASATGAGSTLDDVALEEKIRASKQGKRFADLFDRSAPEGQESEADLGLCNILAFWLGPDEARIDQWFRRSALMRDKWDDKRGETTYGSYTIARALEDRTEFYGQKKTPARPKGDDSEMSYAEEISLIFGLIDDPIVSGWRSSRKATARVVLTTKAGAEFEVDSWRSATSSPPVLAQEIEWQLGVETRLKKEDIKRLNMLVGKFCDDRFAMTARDRAHELGSAYLQEAETLEVDMADQRSRWSAFQKLKQRIPASYAKTEGTSLSVASHVLEDVSGKRYVRIQWFVDYVKACAVAGTASAIVDHIEEPGNWNRIQNAKSQMKATNPETGEHIWQVLYEVPAGWGE